MAQARPSRKGRRRALRGFSGSDADCPNPGHRRKRQRATDRPRAHPVVVVVVAGFCCFMENNIGGTIAAVTPPGRHGISPD